MTPPLEVYKVKTPCSKISKRWWSPCAKSKHNLKKCITHLLNYKFSKHSFILHKYFWYCDVGLNITLFVFVSELCSCIMFFINMFLTFYLDYILVCMSDSAFIVFNSVIIMFRAFHYILQHFILFLRCFLIMFGVRFIRHDNILLYLTMIH